MLSAVGQSLLSTSIPQVSERVSPASLKGERWICGGSLGPTAKCLLKTLQQWLLRLESRGLADCSGADASPRQREAHTPVQLCPFHVTHLPWSDIKLP